MERELIKTHGALSACLVLQSALLSTASLDLRNENLVLATLSLVVLDGLVISGSLSVEGEYA